MAHLTNENNVRYGIPKVLAGRMNKTRILAKRAMQVTLRDLRYNGFLVTKLNAGYQATGANGELVLRAMRGHTGYLVRYNPEVLT